MQRERPNPPLGRRCQDCGRPVAALNPGTRCYACTPDEFSAQGPRRRRKTLPYEEILAAYARIGDATKVANALGLPRSSVWYVIKRAEARNEHAGSPIVAIAPWDGPAASLAGKARERLTALGIESTTLNGDLDRAASPSVGALLLADPPRRGGADWVELVTQTLDRGAIVAALSGAATTFAAASVLRDRRVTACSQGRVIAEDAGARFSDVEVCTDGQIMTAQGPRHLDRLCIELGYRLGGDASGGSVGSP